MGTMEVNLRRDRAGNFCVRREEKNLERRVGRGGGGSLQGENLGGVENNLFRSLKLRLRLIVFHGTISHCFYCNGD